MCSALFRCTWLFGKEGGVVWMRISQSCLWKTGARFTCDLDTRPPLQVPCLLPLCSIQEAVRTMFSDGTVIWPMTFSSLSSHQKTGYLGKKTRRNSRGIITCFLVSSASFHSAFVDLEGVSLRSLLWALDKVCTGIGALCVSPGLRLAP